jgi:predicted nuclease of predicted toxin-antitoxin system
VEISGRAGTPQLKDRFLIDECLSGDLVATAKARGHEADYVPHIGKGGWQDWNLVPFAVENDYIVVTLNRRDFLKQHAGLEVHPGLVILMPQAPRDQRPHQAELFEKALDVFVAMNDDLVNKVMEVLADGSCTSGSGMRMSTTSDTSTIRSGRSGSGPIAARSA